MYRDSVSNVITYTPDDLVLFRESPFAVWMERLSLENPDHGIPPDLDSNEVGQVCPRQDAIVATLRAEGRNVVLIDPQLDEPERRAATLEAMRSGADFIVGAQLSIGNLAGTADMLMRTSGFSELGDFLYIPCETRANSTLHSAFRLCFIADLLANLQGQLPPQLLIIRDGAEVVPLQTDDHIYYYRAVQKRFLKAMDGFRKHRMPDPAESAHFGRWAECASEVLKQRDSSEQQTLEDQLTEQAPEEVAQVAQLRVASGSSAGAQYGAGASERTEFSPAGAFSASATDGGSTERGEFGSTLAEQARLLTPDRYRNGKPPGHTPSLAHIGKPRIVADAKDTVSAFSEADVLAGDVATEKAVIEDSAPRNDAPDALDNLEFIGSSVSKTASDTESESGFSGVITPAPSPNLREVAKREILSTRSERDSGAPGLPDREPRAPVFLPPDEEPLMMPPAEQLTTRRDEHQELGADNNGDTGSVIDLDAAPASTLAPVVQRAEAVFERLIRDDPMFRKVDKEKSKGGWEDEDFSVSPFSNSLKTSEEFNDS